MGGSAPHVGFWKYIQNTGKSIISLMQYRGQMHTGYGPPSSHLIMLLLSVFYTYCQAPTHRISPPNPSIDRNSQKREPLVLFLLLKIIFNMQYGWTKNWCYLFWLEHLFKIVPVKGWEDLYIYLIIGQITCSHVSRVLENAIIIEWGWSEAGQFTLTRSKNL